MILSGLKTQPINPSKRSRATARSTGGRIDSALFLSFQIFLATAGKSRIQGHTAIDIESFSCDVIRLI